MCGAGAQFTPIKPMPAPGYLHIHLEPDAKAVVEFISKTDFIPRLKARSATFIIHDLLKSTSEYKQAEAQMASERHGRPGRK